MDDHDVVGRISELVAEEHRLERAHPGEPLGADEQRRVRELAVALDQCWDLLRQRRARRAAGTDPDAASVRADSTVEGYLQ